MENSDTQLIGAVPVDPGGAELGRLAGGREPQKYLSMARLARSFFCLVLRIATAFNAFPPLPLLRICHPLHLCFGREALGPCATPGALISLCCTFTASVLPSSHHDGQRNSGIPFLSPDSAVGSSFRLSPLQKRVLCLLLYYQAGLEDSHPLVAPLRI